MRTPLLLLATLAAAAPAQSWTTASAVVPATITAWDLARNRLILVGTDTAQRWHEWDGTTIRERVDALAGSPTIGHLRYDPQQQRFLAIAAATPTATAYRVATWRRGSWNWASSATRPTAGNAAVAYDEHRQRLVANTGNLFEWDGQRWWDLGPTSMAPASSGAPLAYDPNLQRCILYSGSVGTWAWDGFAWTLVGGTSPGPREHAALAFDRSRNGLVMYGGSNTSTDTWLWNGSGWSLVPTVGNPGVVIAPQLHDDGHGVTLFDPTTGNIWQLRSNTWHLVETLAPGPVTRSNTAFAYDFARHVVVGFGGDQGGLNVPPAQTMLFDRRWLACTPATNPPLRHSAHLAWSDADQEVLLFGGTYQGTIHRGDTWSWNGSDWTVRSPSQGPAAREGAVFAPDPLGGVMLFGGKDATTTFGDHWHWNGSDWTPVLVSTPSPRSRTRHAYDPLRGIVVVLAGNDANQAYLAETWTWNGSVWHRHSPATSPFNMRTAAFHPQSGRVVVADAINAFEWDGAEWRAVSGLGTGVNPPLFARFATHFGRHELLNFSVPSVKRWTTFAAQVDTYGNACANGPVPTLAALEPPRFDAAMQLEVAASSGAAPTFLVLGLAARSLDLGGGCRSLVAQDLGVRFELAEPNGIARFDLPIPNDPGLLGLQFTAQGAIYEPSRSPLGSVTLTSGLRCLVGQ